MEREREKMASERERERERERSYEDHLVTQVRDIVSSSCGDAGPAEI